MLLRLLCMFSWMCLSFYTQASANAVKTDYAFAYFESVQTISQVQSLDRTAWEVVDAFPNHGFKLGEHWLRVGLTNTSSNPQDLIYRFAYPLHDEVDFYEVDSSGRVVKIWLQGDMRDQTQHDVMDKHAAIRIALGSNQAKHFYIRVKSKNAAVLTTDILSTFEHAKNVHFEAIFSSLIYGVLLVMVLYNLGLAIALKDKVYFSYVFYVMSFTAFVLTLSGDGYYYLWNKSPLLNQYLLPILSGLLIIPSLLFPYCLLNMKYHVPAIAKLYKGFMLVALLFVLSIPIIGVAKAVVFVNSLSAVLSIIMLLIGIYMTYKKIPFAGLYTFAWVILLIGLSVLSVSSLGLIESNIMTRNAGLLGGVIEAIILSLALAKRISEERKEKLLAVEDAMQNRKLFQELFDQAPIGILRYNLSGELVTINPVLVKMLEYNSQEQALQELKILDKLLTDYRQINLDLIEHGQVLDKEITIKTANDNELYCSVSLHLNQDTDEQYIEAYLTDISERVESQRVKAFMEQERLTSMEHLITGVAHEINTPLGVNITSASHIKEILSEVNDEMTNKTLTRQKFMGFISDTQQLLDIVTHNLNKMSNLVRRFKMVSMGKTDKVSLNFKKQLEQSLYSHHLIEEDVAITVNCNADMNIESYPIVWSIIVEQLVENSIVHGFSKEQIRKSITINVTQADNGFWHFDYLDNGRGLDSTVLQKAFNPFVTTKRSSIDHAGLGLYRIYNLVQRVLKAEVELIQGDGFHLAITFQADELKLVKSA
ncbi:hypothetical protein NBRC116188_22110 [Oceaniserpentilla sp. 4NH20-0058]|uniref:7TM diverse intracellular signaling domain-containing protein n=1 Tax=Oceaniserpentilla sp. 4NH20-0058 TaxID=3127660 RepID=UPI00310B6938